MLLCMCNTYIRRWQFAFHSVVQYIKKKKGRSIWDQLCFRRLVHILQLLTASWMFALITTVSWHWLCRSMCKEYSEHYEKSLTVAKASKELRNKIHVGSCSDCVQHVLYVCAPLPRLWRMTWS